MSRWWAVTLSPPAEALEQAMGLLYLSGAGGVEYEDGRPAEAPWTDEPVEPGTPFVRAYYPDDETWPARWATLETAAAERGWAVRRDATDEEDWAHAWRAYYRPIRPGARLWVVPAWLDPPAEAPSDSILLLDPGMAFGTGTHPTTALLIRMAEDRVASGSRWLDVGTGSGILALAAWRLGASVDALDPDPVAVRQAEANLARNGAPVSVWTGTLADFPGVGPYAGILANLTAALIVQELSNMLRFVDRGSWLLLSGIVLERETFVLDALYGVGARVVDRAAEGGWVALAASV
jgi:ribosomal protein L11 methyltransferase